MSFDFSFCDVIIGRLEKVFELGSPSLKACAAIAAARLESDHNRWLVMRRLLMMCGHSLEENVAQRLSIEILAEEVGDEFCRCATRIGEKTDMFHPRIKNALDSLVPF